MNEKDWRLLITISEEKSLTRTAQKLCLTQPAVTRRIQQLEEEMGCTIVIRGIKGVELSSEGEYLVSYADRALQELDAVKEQIDNRSGVVKGTLRLAAANAYAKRCLPRLLKSFSEKYPSVDIHLTTGYSQKIYRLLISNTVHIAILRGVCPWNENALHLRADPYYYVVSATPINLEELPNLPQIHCLTDTPLETELNLWWTANYHKPARVTTVVDRSDICLEMVREGLGYSLLSGLYIESKTTLFRRRIVFPDGHPMSRATHVYCRSSSLGIKVVQAFWDSIKEYDEQTSGDGKNTDSSVQARSL